MAMQTLKLAWRNLGRNRRRTLITGSALAFGTALCVGAYGLSDGMTADMLHSLTRLDLGHLQVHQPEFPRRRRLRLTLPDADKVAKAVAREPGVVAASKRLYSYALVSRENKSAGVQVIGIDPVAEPRVTDLKRQTVAGRFLGPQPTPWPRGRALTSAEQQRDRALTDQAEKEVLDELESLGALDEQKESQPSKVDKSQPSKVDKSQPSKVDKSQPSKVDKSQPSTLLDPQQRQLSQRLARKLSPPPVRPPQVLIGSGLARILRVKVGDRFYAMSQTVDGMSEEITVQVVGIYKTSTEQLDRGRMYMHLHDAQRLSHLYDRVHEVAAVVHEPERAAEVAASVRHQLGDRPDLLVRSWDEIRPDIKNILALNEAGMAITIFIIFIVATLGVVNTMLMAVFERTRELGMLKAIGMRSGQVVRLVVTETTLLAFASALVGTLLGLGLDLYLVHFGIDLSSNSEGFSIGGIGLDAMIRGAITVHGVVLPLLVLTLSCFVASFYPAIRAARLRPAAGMREL